MSKDLIKIIRPFALVGQWIFTVLLLTIFSYMNGSTGSKRMRRYRSKY